MLGFKSVTLPATLIALACLTTAPAFAMADTPKQVDVPPGELVDALETLAKQCGVDVVYPTEQLKGLRTQGVTGVLETEAAFRKLLKGTPLILRHEGVSLLISLPTNMAAPRNSRVVPGDVEGKTPSSGPFWLAQVDQAASANTASVETPDSQRSSNGPVRLEEVVVTAQKREERLLDVPVAMTVLDPRSLAQNGQVKLADYFASIPGLNVNGNGLWGGTQYLTIRGLSAGRDQSGSVATVIDDVPVTASTYDAQGMVTSPDIDPSDLARIEVLKGPQGTLYGADSLSGLIKYVTADPSTTEYSGRAEVAGVDIPQGGIGYVVRGAANIPVSDTFAVRVSAFSRNDPGYIDDLVSGEKNINTANAYGGRLGALWRPSESFSVKVSALVQRSHGYVSFVDSNARGQFPVGDLKTNELKSLTAYSNEAQVYTATINGKVAGLNIVSVTGYVVNSFDNWKDFSQYFGGYSCIFVPSTCEYPAGYPGGTGGSPSEAIYSTHKVSEELRVSASIGSWLDWRLAGFYTHENSAAAHQTEYIANLTTGALVDNLFSFFNSPLTYSEHAVFGDLVAHFTDRFDLELGAREGWNLEHLRVVSTGLAEPLFNGGAPSPLYGPDQRASGNAFTYLITPRLKLSSDLMAYARVASGYRIGGPNAAAYSPAARSLGVPGSYAPDRTKNYELGLKAALLDQKLSFDLAVYYIDWSSFQVFVNQPYPVNGGTVNFGFTANAGNAKSQGVELAVDMHPARGLTVSLSASYDDAVLTQDIPKTAFSYGLKGDPLPYSMKYSGSLSVNQDIPLAGDWVGFVGGAVDYVGKRPFEFAGSPTAPRVEIPGYTVLNLRGGAHYNSWLFNLYVNNVANKRGVVGLTPSFGIAVPGYSASVITPRAIGFGVSKTF